MYYFKIPIIREKWIEKYKEEEITLKENNKKKKKSNDINQEKEKIKVIEINKIINGIIFVLDDLFILIRSKKI